MLTYKCYNSGSFETDDINHEKWKTSVPESHVLSQRPLIHLVKNCISESEQKELLKLVKQKLTAKTNSGSSSSIYLQEKSDAKLAISRKIARLAGMISKLPWKLAEPMSLTKYTTGQNYGLHYDSGFYMQDKKVKRMGTFLVYLNDVKSGGETIFPYATNDTSKIFDEIDIKKLPIKDVCSTEGLLKVLPRARNCLLFHNHLSTDFGGVRDSWSLHGSCPIISGEKLIAQIWLHDEPWGKDFGSFWTD